MVDDVLTRVAQEFLGYGIAVWHREAVWYQEDDMPVVGVVERLNQLREKILLALRVEDVALSSMWPRGEPRFDGGALCGTWADGRHFDRSECCCRCGRERMSLDADWLLFLCIFGRFLWRSLEDSSVSSHKVVTALEHWGRQPQDLSNWSSLLGFAQRSAEVWRDIVALEIPAEMCVFNAKIEDEQAKRMLAPLFLKGAFDSSVRPVLCKDCCVYFIRQGVEGDWCKSSLTETVACSEIVIDGSNVIRAGNSCGVVGLQALLRNLQSKGVRCHVLFDANVIHVVGEEFGSDQAQILQRMIDESAGMLSCVPGGSRADEYILLRANTDGLHILSNDQYRDYQSQYPWIAEERRVHKFVFTNGRLLIPDLGIDAKIDRAEEGHGDV